MAKNTKRMREYQSWQDRKDENQRNRKPRFDGTVTLGNVISMVTMLCTIIALWRNMESRVLLVEERQRVQGQTVDRLVTTVENVVLVQARQINTQQRNP